MWGSVEHTHAFDVRIPIDELFQLFSPEGEKLWVPDWDYENISGDEKIHEDYVFLTNNHDHGDTQAIWIVKKYDAEKYYVQYYKIEPQDKIGIVTVQCYDFEKITRVSVTYKYIALSEIGKKLIDDFSKENYEEYINEWKCLIDNYYK
jgi:hypothetical protein